MANTEDVSTVNYSDNQIALKNMSPEIMKIFKGADEAKLYWNSSCPSGNRA